MLQVHVQVFDNLIITAFRGDNRQAIRFSGWESNPSLPDPVCRDAHCKHFSGTIAMRILWNRSRGTGRLPSLRGYTGNSGAEKAKSGKRKSTANGPDCQDKGVK
jgi:hypothetical protein